MSCFRYLSLNKIGTEKFSIAGLAGILFLVLICSVYTQTSGGNNYTTSSPELEQVSILTFPFKDVDHKPVVTAIAFTANQSDVIVGGDDAQVYIWNTEDDNTTASFSLVERNDWVRFVDFSPLNDSFATASQDGTISIWDAQDYKLVRTLSPKVVGAKALCYAPNGKVLAVCGYDAKVVLFNPMDGTHIGDWATPNGNLETVQFSPDGTLFAVGGRKGGVRVWNTVSGQVMFDLKEMSRRVHSLSFNSDGTRLAATGEDNKIVIWDMKTGSVVKSINTNVGKTFSLVFCGDNRIASGDSFNLIRVWDITSGTEIAHGTGHSGTIAILLYDAQKNRLISGSFDTTIQCWQLPD